MSEQLTEWLTDVLEADEAEESILAKIAELKDDLKALKETLKSASAMRRASASRVRAAFRETYPLFDRGKAAEEPKPRLAAATA